MNYQKARLIMAANSLGRPEDIPSRSLEALRTAQLLVFEEDRPARAALKAAGVHRDYWKLSEHRQEATLEAVLEAFQRGETVCYMSDQGVPVVADPGRELLELAYRHKVKVEVIPGPSSITAALQACPFLGNGFRFVGFLPQKSDERKGALRELSNASDCLVILDTPYRLGALLIDCAESLTHERQALLAFNISCDDEEFCLGKLGELKARFSANPEKRNFVLIVRGSEKAPVDGKNGKGGSKAKKPGARP